MVGGSRAVGGVEPGRVARCGRVSGLAVDQHVDPGVGGRAAQHALDRGLLCRVAGHAALPPDDQVGTAGAADRGGEGGVRGEALGRIGDVSRLDECDPHDLRRRRFGTCPSIQRRPSAQRRQPEQGTRTGRGEQPGTGSAPGRRHHRGQRDVHGHHQHAEQPHSAQGGGLTEQRRVPLRQTQHCPRPAQDGYRPHGLGEHPHRRHHRHGQPEPARRRSVTQQAVRDHADGHPQQPQQRGDDHEQQHALGREPVVERRGEPGAGQPRPQRRLTPRRGCGDQQQHRDQRHPRPPPQRRLRKRRGHQRPATEGQSAHRPPCCRPRPGHQTTLRRPSASAPTSEGGRPWARAQPVRRPSGPRRQPAHGFVVCRGSRPRQVSEASTA